MPCTLNIENITEMTAHLYILTFLDASSILRCPEFTSLLIPTITEQRKANLDNFMPKLRSVMLFAIHGGLKHVVCPENDVSTQIDIIVGVQTNTGNIHQSQLFQWKNTQSHYDLKTLKA